MTTFIESLEEALEGVEAVVCDQWGVLHNGTTPYPHAREVLHRVREKGKTIAVISNSGKRAKLNLKRIIGMGFEPSLFDQVITSGESLWRVFDKFTQKKHIQVKLFGIACHGKDLNDWAEGMAVEFTDINQAEAILLMGLADEVEHDFQQTLSKALSRGIPMYCSNPDLVTLTSSGQLARAPGALAQDFAQMGGEVHFYGKPYLRIFRVAESLLDLPADKLLIVGDSLQHDIMGGQQAGWKTLFVRGGIDAERFTNQKPVDIAHTLKQLAKEKNTPLPDFSIATLK